MLAVYINIHRMNLDPGYACENVVGYIPIPSMYGILFTYIWLIVVVNVGKYTSLHESYGSHRLLGCENGYQTHLPEPEGFP